MTLVRAFIALEIPASIQTAIQDQTASLRQAADASLVRWVNTANIHLTLKFLGDVSSASLPFLTQMLSAEAAQHRSFGLQVSRLGSFPTPKRPRVIWIGIQAPPALAELQHGIEAASRRLGYETEARTFSPHLTIGRVRQNLAPTDVQRVYTALESCRVGLLGSVDVRAVHLIRSDLRPEGSYYTRLHSAPLGPPEPGAVL
jgi:2'-5' RNA ligase